MSLAWGPQKCIVALSITAKTLLAPYYDKTLYLGLVEITKDNPCLGGEKGWQV